MFIFVFRNFIFDDFDFVNFNFNKSNCKVKSFIYIWYAFIKSDLIELSELTAKATLKVASSMNQF